MKFNPKVDHVLVTDNELLLPAVMPSWKLPSIVAMTS
jgi:hypothetical protein